MTKEKSKFRETDRKSILLGSVFAILIAISPYLFYAYESVPEQAVWDTLFFKYTSVHYENAQVAFWTITGKVMPLYFLVIWFFTCRHWWYHALLIPIIMYIIQLVSVINEDISYFDSLEIVYFLPFMAVIIPSIYLIRAQLFDRINTVNKSTQDLEDELKIKPKNLIDKIKQYF
ncbi:hypothetical protein [Bizionia paragorgiae]|mgnify:CR=1 FL=1|uniref:hypothetical protein n=1 Tax=Bizionia paragorgiae TaxID=283786 RepID=UPI00299EBD3F|nr:hypothetical protein [Bizionia paragorgiae]MDX1270904.1 hypothetical protein [Bizionia paragorgiae]